MSAIEFKKGDRVILISGFGAYSRENSNGIYYWGGKLDLQEELRAKGHQVDTAVISPFSSNWDRACELYAWIFGGVTDYGIVHSKKFGHKRFGREFSGILKKGETGTFHLVGHSLGGNTGRLFSSLFYWGDEEEQNTGKKISPLFRGFVHSEGRSWKIGSLSCISTPFRGTTAVFLPGSHQKAAKRFFKILYDLDKLVGSSRDFILDQWEMAPDEWIENVFPEDFQTPSLIGKDSAINELIPEFSGEYFEGRLDSPVTIYQCWSASVEESIGILPPVQTRMNPLLLPFFRFMQNHVGAGGKTLSSHNDGLVNSSSMIMPEGATNSVPLPEEKKSHSGSNSVPRKDDSIQNSNIIQGEWNYRGHWINYPHWELHGNFLRKARGPGLDESLSDWFDSFLNELYQLTGYDKKET